MYTARDMFPRDARVKSPLVVFSGLLVTQKGDSDEGHTM